MKNKIQKEIEKMCIICSKKYENQITFLPFTRIPLYYEENTLNCVGCQSIDEIPILPELSSIISLKNLNCSSSSLKILPRIDLINIDCSRCDIREIPPYPNLENLKCEQTLISEIPKECKNLKTLRLFSTSIKDIPLFEKLVYLDISACSIKKLPKFPVLKTLVCQTCVIEELELSVSVESVTACYSALRKICIDSLENSQLKDLSILHCTDFKELQPFPKLEYLSASGSALETLPFLPVLKTLNINRTNIKKISGFPLLERLSCACCFVLSEISSLPNLKILDCSCCVKIKDITDLKFLEYLRCSNCRFLIKIPENDYKELSTYNTPWIQGFTLKQNIDTLIKAQKITKKFFKYSVIKRYIKSKEFAEWFYDPKNFGGYKYKQRLAKLFEK